MACASRDKKTFDECVHEVTDEDLNESLCVCGAHGEPNIRPEAEWIFSLCAERGSRRTGEVDGPRDQRVRQEVIAWSKRDEVTTLKRLLQELYDRGEYELVTKICNELKISDDRKIGPSSEGVSTPISTQPIRHMHTVAREERDDLELQLLPKNSAPGTNIHPPSISKNVNPINATEQHGGKHMASYEMDGELKNSVAVQEKAKLKLGTRMHNVKRVVEGMKDESKKARAKWKQEIDELRKQLQTKHLEIQKLKEELALEINFERENRLAAEASRDELQRQVDELQSQVDKLERQLQEKNDEIQLLNGKKRAFEVVDHPEDNGDCHEDRDEVNNGCTDTCTANLVHSDESTLFLPHDRAIGYNKSIKKWGKHLGCGSYGEVYAVQLEGCDVSYAAKIQKTNKLKWLNEIFTLQLLRHENIVGYIGLSLYKDDVVLIMELMDTSLSTRLYNTNSINIFTHYEELRILRDVASGLDYLHTRKTVVIHRDLTANNVLLTGCLRAKIADFGNSRIVTIEEHSKQFTCYPGTRAYSAPEVGKGKYDEKCDIFSFAHLTLCTLSKLRCDELATSRSTDPGGHLVALNEVQRRSVYFEYLKEINKEILLEALMIEQCLAMSPSERPSACLLKQILNHKLAHERNGDELRVADPTLCHKSTSLTGTASSSDDDNIL